MYKYAAKMNAMLFENSMHYHEEQGTNITFVFISFGINFISQRLVKGSSRPSTRCCDATFHVGHPHSLTAFQ